MIPIADWTVYNNFSRAEFVCKCGCGRADMDAHFMTRLQRLRTSLARPVVVTSGFRCPDHNARVSRTGRTGPHTTGRATDLAEDRAAAFAVIAAAPGLGFTGLGIQQKGAGRFLHLDDLDDGPGQPRPTVWSY